MKKLYSALIFALFNQVSFGQSFEGRILNESTNAPLRKAVFLARNDAGRVLIGIESDQNGMFSTCDVTDSILHVKVYKEGFDTIRMELRGMPQGRTNLGNIYLRPCARELNEITVTASPVIQGTDKFIVYPSAREVQVSATSISLLDQLQYKLPGLRVTESLGQVTVNGQTPEYMVNGRKVPFSRIQGLNNSNILRVEYYDTPQMRFGDRPAINFILKPRSDGGAVVANLMSALTTGNIGGNIGLTYFKGKSEWNINYGISWRDYDDRRVNNSEEFHGPVENIFRQNTGNPGKFGYTDNNLSLDYTWMPSSKTLFAASVSGNLYRQHLNDLADIFQSRSDIESHFESYTHRNARVKSPAADLYFRQQTGQNQRIEVQAFGTYNDGHFDRDYLYGTDAGHIIGLTDNTAWRTGGEVKYSIDFNNLSAYFGISDSYNRATTKYRENGAYSHDRININNIFAFAQISGRIGPKFSYSTNVGLKNFHSSDSRQSETATRLKGSLNMTYKVSRPFSLQYMIMYDPSMPNTMSQSNIVQSVNDIELRTGYMGLKPWALFKNQLKAQLYYRDYVAVLSGSHSRTYNPIYYGYSQIDDAASPWFGKYLGRDTNGRYNQCFSIQAEFLRRNLFKNLNIGVWGGWCHYQTKRELRDDSYAFWHTGISLGLYVRDWTFSAQYTIAPFYSLNGNTYSRPERWNTITAQYKYRNWYFKLTGVNLFTKRGSLYHSWSYTPAYSFDQNIEIRNCANMVMLSVSYRANFGRSMNKGKRTVKNGGVDSGIDMTL